MLTVEKMKEGEQISLLVVSDIHLFQCHLSQVKQYIAEKKITVDVVIGGGDFCNLKGEEYENKESLENARTAMEEILKELETIAPQVFYVPGNHDPLSTFDLSNSEFNCQKALNIHGSVTKVLPSLWIAGFGGAPPAFLKDSDKMAWSGYPFQSDQEVREQLSKLNDKIKQAVNQDQQNTSIHPSVILLTHFGPDALDTTLYYQNLQGPFVLSGSSSLRELLYEKHMQKYVCINIHGHTHPGKGVSHLDNITVFNPGSLKEGNYGFVNLKRGKECWFVESTSLVHFEV